MLVAIVDDGVNTDLFPVGPLRYDMIVTENARVRPRKEDERITTPHGTIVAAIICKYAPDAEICSIKIFSGEILKTTCDALIAALKWCGKMKIPVINLSLGTIDPDDFKRVNRVTDKLLKKGCAIVAACNNNGSYTLPAMHPGVLGVCASAELLDNQYIMNPPGEEVRFAASSRHTLTFRDGSIFQTRFSNSYAAPTITAAYINGELSGRCFR